MAAAAVVPVILQDERNESKLKRHFGVVWDLMMQKGMEDIHLNPDHKLWYKVSGSPMKLHGTFSPREVREAGAAMATIAHIWGRTLNEWHPVLETTIPFNGSRIQGLIPPIVAAPSFAIRCRATTVYTLANYVAAGIMSETHCEAIENAILARKNILTIGGTGSGKTTLSNAFLDSMANLTPDHRVAIIEDTGELQCKVENAITLLASPTITMNDCLNSCMRLKPDRIIVGEVRGPEALALLKAWNSGHDGGFATIHANNARAGLVKLESLVEEATIASKQKLIAEVVNLVVFIAPDPTVPAKRRVKEVYEVVGYDQDTRQYQFKEL